MKICQSWHSGISQIPCHPLWRKGTWRRWNRDILARMPMNDYTKAGTRATLRSSSSISIMMSQFRAEKGVLSWIGRSGSQTIRNVGSAFRNRADRRIPSEGFNLQLLINNKRLETGKEGISLVTLAKGPYIVKSEIAEKKYLENPLRRRREGERPAAGG